MENKKSPSSRSRDERLVSYAVPLQFTPIKRALNGSINDPPHDNG